MNYKIDKTVPGSMGMAKVESVKFGKTFAFNIKEDVHGHTEFKNIQGVETIVSTPFGKTHSPIDDMVISHDGSGEPIFTVKAENQIKLSRALGAPAEVSVAVQMDGNGGIKVVNHGHDDYADNHRHGRRRERLLPLPPFDLEDIYPKVLLSEQTTDQIGKCF